MNNGVHPLTRSRRTRNPRGVGAAASDCWTGPTECLGKNATNSQIWLSFAWTNSPAAARAPRSPVSVKIGDSCTEVYHVPTPDRLPAPDGTHLQYTARECTGAAVCVAWGGVQRPASQRSAHRMARRNSQNSLRSLPRRRIALARPNRESAADARTPNQLPCALLLVLARARMWRARASQEPALAACTVGERRL